MTDELKGRVFTQEEVNAILSRAVELRSPASGGLTYEEIVDAARQAGIPADAVEAAATEVETKRPVAREDDLVRDEVAARTWRARRKFDVELFVETLESLEDLRLKVCEVTR